MVTPTISLSSTPFVFRN